MSNQIKKLTSEQKSNLEDFMNEWLKDDAMQKDLQALFNIILFEVPADLSFEDRMILYKLKQMHEICIN